MKNPLKISLAFSPTCWLKTFPVILFCLFADTQQLLGQLTDDFSDGEFTSNPAWTGDDAKFVVDQNQLRLQAPAVSDVADLATASEAFYDASWEFIVRLEFNPASGNYARVYLASDQADLSGPLNGYFVLIGDTPDEVSLYKQSGSTRTKIIDGADGRVNLSLVNVKVRVTRDASGNWELFSDVGPGGTYTSEGTVNDVTHSSSSFFGVFCLYTSTRSDKFYFDDFIITGEAFVDVLPPDIDAVEAISGDSLRVTFSEAVDPAGAGNTSHYEVSDGIGSPSSAFPEPDGRTVILAFDNTFPNGIERTLYVRDIADLHGNLMDGVDRAFVFFSPVPAVTRDIIISELLADPTPPIALPEAEFVEIHNNSASPFDLSGWQITDGASTGILGSLLLLPGEYLILTPAADQAAYSIFGKCMGLSVFPSLNNSSDMIRLVSPEGLTIDSVSYSTTWFSNAEKKDGGWSLEIIDPTDVCRGALNWDGSLHESGGTPGQQNSIFAHLPDTVGPRLLGVSRSGDRQIALQFDEALDKAAPSAGHFFIAPLIELTGAAFGDEAMTTVYLSLQQDPDSVETYRITVENVYDCPGNAIQAAYASAVLKLDTVKPGIQSVNVVAQRELTVTFTEKVDEFYAEDVLRYVVADLGSPVSAILATDAKSVNLVFEPLFPNGVDQVINISGITDLAGNAMAPADRTFRYFSPVEPEFRDIVITELMPDPAPVIGLPEAEFIEILNNSSHPFDLSGWQVTDGSGTGILASLILLPGEYLILCANSSGAAFSAYGRTMGLSVLPSLNNASDNIRLLSPDGKAIDSVSYSNAWYANEEKSDGGWSLEIIDPEDQCKGPLNWSSSQDGSGGTPGRRNSVFADLEDTTGPRFLAVSRVGEGQLLLEFDEQLDRTPPGPGSFTIAPALPVTGVSFADGTHRKIILSLSADLDSAETYHIAVQNVLDCPGNTIQAEFSALYLKLDSIPPAVTAVHAIAQKVLEVTFDEPVDSLSAKMISHYSIPDFGNPDSIAVAVFAQSVTLFFAKAFVNGVQHSINVEHVEDRAGNPMAAHTTSFMYFKPVLPAFRDIVITELLPDPAPVTGLPESEFIEIYNNSSDPFELSGWKIADGGGAGVLTSMMLLPGEYLILCGLSSETLFSGFGKTMGMPVIPSLNNAADEIRLISPEGVVIDSVHYSSAWHSSEEKKDGGWSLEMIDPDDVCRGSQNWTSSRHASGGTPGSQNSAFDRVPDVTGPRLLGASAPGANAVVLDFDEPLSGTIPAAESFNIDPPLAIADIAFADERYTKILLSLSVDIDSTKTYRIAVTDVFDCPGNPIQEDFSEVMLKLDTVSPGISRVDVINQRELQVIFSEKTDKTSAENVLSYVVTGAGHPRSASLSEDQRSGRLLFEHDFSNGVMYDLHVDQLMDLAGNAMRPSTLAFMFFRPAPAFPKDIVITEILADPAPPAGLPEVEFVELYNRSESPFQLHNWRLKDATSSADLPPWIFLPGEYLILCPASRAAQYSSRGQTLGLPAFPSLSNSGEALVLSTPEGLVIDSVNYSDSWYRDDELAEGGWSLELIDPENTCAEAENWSASEDETGGTPGRVNSVLASKPDLTGPVLLSAFPSSDSTVLLSFNEKLEKKLPSAGDFITAPSMEVTAVAFADATLTAFRLTLSGKLQGGIEHSIAARNIYDCAGNMVQPEFSKVSYALPEPAAAHDVLVNEILFNPRPTGVDFVEFFNRSHKFINLKNWQIARFEGDTILAAEIISREDFLLAPQAYIVFTEDGNVLKGEYLRGKEEVFFEMDLPAFPDEDGSVALLDDKGIIIDDFYYSEGYHSALIRDDEGVSLERISFDSPTQDVSNWKSASTVSGYATPGYLNSNARTGGISSDGIIIEPEIFIPQSGQADFTQIRFSFEKAGYVANVRIFDPRGREIRRIANNVLIGAEGFFRWDGDQENGSRARIGAYMVWVEIFDPGGNIRTFRKRVVVAGRL